MNFTGLFLLAAVIQVSAGTVAQTVTYSGDSVALEKVFSAIKEQTGYVFFYDENDLKESQPVTVRLIKVPLETALEKLLSGQPFRFQLTGNTVFISRKPPGVENIVHDDLPGIYDRLLPPIRGVVTDEQGKPLPNATIGIKGKPGMVKADQYGIFVIDAAVGDVLLISIVGYAPKEVQVQDADKNLAIELKVNPSSLDEVNIVAYGSTTRRETTGSISVVKAKEIEGIPSSNIANLLQGRVAGMDITNISGSPGAGGLAITIRGYNSLDVEQGRRFSNPLWVVDGVPINTFTSPVTGTNLLAEINPDMIESIQILKDASSAAIYGSRAANGVIIVTTKKGKRNQEAKFSVNVSRTENILPSLPTVTIGKAERDFRLRALMNDPKAYLDMETLRYVYPVSYEDNYLNSFGSIDYFFTPQPGSANGLLMPFIDSLNPFYNNATNFFPMYYTRGEIINGNIQTYGGSDKISYGIGLGFYEEKGILKGSGFQRIDLNSNINVALSKKLNIDLRFNTSLTNRRRGEKVDNFGFGSSPIIETVPGDPFALSTLFPGEGTAVWNSVLEKLGGTKEKNRSVRLRASFKINYELLDGLTLSSSIASDYSVHRRNYFQPSYLSQSNYSSSIGQTGINLMALNENLVSYNKIIDGKHKINAVAGFSYQYDQVEYNGGRAENSPSDRIYYAMPGFPTIGQRDYGGFVETIAFQNYVSDMQEKALISYFGKLDYGYKGKYLATASLRRDGSSVFGENNKWGVFPSFAAGWVFTEEQFLEGASSWFNHGKFRASWGKSGMHFSQNYLALGIIQLSPYPFQGSGVLVPDYGRGLFNESLSWEETSQWDFGVDLDLFDQRFGVTFDYYFRYTDKMLMPVRLPSTYTGYFEQWRNAAAVSNEGIELLLNYEIVRKPEMFWKASFNVARNWNRFEKSYDGQDASVDPNRPRMIIGKPLNGIYALRTDGFVNSQDELPLYFNAGGISNYFSPTSKQHFYKPGDLKFVDIDGDGILTEADKIYTGSALPFITGGFVNQFKWKDFDANLLFSFQLGRHMVNTTAVNSLLTNPGSENGAWHPILMDLDNISFWGEQNKENPDFPTLQTDNLAYLYDASVDRYVEKVNWCKLKTLSVGYNLARVLTKNKWLEQFRIFLTGENLLTFTNYSGLDPETVDIVTGFDYGVNYPLARRFTFGVTVKF